MGLISSTTIIAYNISYSIFIKKIKCLNKFTELDTL